MTEYREEPCRSALNRVKGMPFNWSLNPYTGCAHRCTFCYVRAFERRADRPSDDRYGTSIRVKVNVADVLRKELARRSWKRELVAIGAATDPYQPAEGRYRLTRSCLELLADAETPYSIVTRGPMIVRDIDVLAEGARRADASVTFSIPTLDHEIWRRTEIATAPPHQRLRALSRLVAAGVRAGVGMAPILPGLTDDPRLMADVVRAARDAGATYVWANVLYLRPGTREHFLENLARDWPDLLPAYERLYAGRAYLGHAERDPVQRVLKDLRREFGIADRRDVRLEERSSAGPHEQVAGREPERKEPVQLAIASAVDLLAPSPAPQGAVGGRSAGTIVVLHQRTDRDSIPAAARESVAARPVVPTGAMS